MTQPWRSPPALQTLFREANERWPKRKKHSDGTIGDEHHLSRTSDHNPDAQGNIHAVDVTHDPDNGPDCERLATFLVLRRDSRVKYIIWNSRWIWSDDWIWKPYPYIDKYGPHTHHIHVSIKSTPEAEKDTKPWLDINLAEWALVLLEIKSREAEKQAKEEELAHLETLASLYPLSQANPGANNVPMLATLLGAVRAVAKSLAVGHTVQQEPPEMRLPPPPPGYRRAVPPFAVVQEANRLKENGVLKSAGNPTGLPVGSYLVRQFNGKYFVFLVEWHEHPPEHNVSDRLKKPHRGFSIFEKKP